jgi:putative hemolysin
MVSVGNTMIEHHEYEPVLSLPEPPKGWRGAVQRLFHPLVAWILRIEKINRIEMRMSDRVIAGEADTGQVYIEDFDLTVDCSEEQIENIPLEGPIIITANHPMGGHDAMSLLALVEKRRPDVKMIVNEILGRMRFMQKRIITVNVFGDPDGNNSASMKEAVRHVRSGGALIVLPAGEVSHLKLRNKVVTDCPWKANVAGLIKLCKAPVVPAFIAGRNSWYFQVLGLIHPTLRTMLLPHETIKHHHCSIPIRLGPPIPADRIKRFESSEDLAQYLRAMTYLLGDRTREEIDPLVNEEKMHKRQATWAKIADKPMHSGEELEQELHALGSDALLISQSNLEVWCARAGDIPRLMLEVGRLREAAFRDVGEGSGRSLDLDRYDGWYWQLLLWDKKKKQLAGGYRLGMTDEIVPGHGLSGLYTHSLFEYGPELLDRISPAIELGRSYVREEYQRKPTTLLLLWRAIGAFIVLHPDHHRLFGPVSISNEFTSMSRQLLVAFLQTHRAIPKLADLVKPRNPMKFRPSQHWDERRVAQAITDPEDLDALVKTIEFGRRSMPILLRQYLKLDAKLLAANVDRDFGDVLDGLMFADMLHLDRRVMRFFIGEDGMERFLTYHGVPVDDSVRKARRTRS